MSNCSVSCCKKRSGTSNSQKDGVTFHIKVAMALEKHLHEHGKVNETWLPGTVAVKKPRAQPVLSPRSKSDCGAQSSSGRSVGSNLNISATTVPLPSKVIKSKKHDKETVLPQSVNSSSPKSIFDLKRQEFIKFRKQFIQQQNKYLDRYAQMREMEARFGVSSLSKIGEVRVLSVSDWSSHDLQLIAAVSAPTQRDTELKEDLGLKIIKRQTAQVGEICEEVLAMGTELLKRRSEVLKFIRATLRTVNTNSQWQAKSAEFDEESIALQELVLSTVKQLEVKLTQNVDTAKIPWQYRENMINKIECLQRELLHLQRSKQSEDASDKKKFLEDLQRERGLCVRLKEMLASAEDRVTTARARIADLERQLSGNTTRSKLKELKEHAAVRIQEAEKREIELTSHLESLLVELEKQEKQKELSEKLAAETEERFKDLQKQYNMLQNRSRLLVEAQHMKCLEYLPKEGRQLRKELELEEGSRAKRTDLKCAKNEMAEDAVKEEQTVAIMHKKIEELTENNKIMQEQLKRYENQISALRVDVSLLRCSNDYKCCDQDSPLEELKKQVFDLCLQVEQLTRERDALASEATVRALLLERHERCAELFTCVTRARRELEAQLEGAAGTTPSASDAASKHEMLNLMSKTYRCSARTWTALRAERARVLQLEGVVRAQAQQLERESLVRVKQDRQRAQLERELLRTWASAASATHLQQTVRKEAESLTSDS